MNIRKIEEEDLNQLLELYTYLHDDDAPLPDGSVINDTWNKIQSSDDFAYFGAFLDHKLVASCSLALIPNLTRGCRPYGVIENVVTHIRHRRNGYGHSILKKTLDYAWSKNCYKVMLLTGRLNEETFNFYESVGFNRHLKQAFIAKPL